MSEILEIPIARTHVGWGARVSLEPAHAPPPEPTEIVSPIARTLALAHTMQAMIDRGEVRDQAELARVLGFTRARITQMLDLTLLAPDIQEEILADQDVGAAICERDLRALVRSPRWNDQVARFRATHARRLSDGERSSDQPGRSPS